MNTFDSVNEQDDFGQLENLMHQEGGPHPSDYSFLDAMFRNIASLEEPKKERAIDKVRQILAPTLDPTTMQGRAFSKPRGYAGDFETIDLIYAHSLTQNLAHRGWDEYFHAQAAPQAVRNRRQYFVNLMKERSESVQLVLNVGSGPGRDLADWLEIVGDQGPSIDCLDLDGNA